MDIQAAGVNENGLALFRVRMTVDQSSIQVGMDGAVVPSVIPGDQGEFDIEVWQTSILHQQMLAWYNAIKTARDQGDVSNWFGTTVFGQSIVDGTTHTGVGCAPVKVPDKAYDVQAGRIVWTVRACSITHGVSANQ